MPKMGPTPSGANYQPGCNFMRLSEDTGGNAFRMGGDSPTNHQETSRGLSTDTERLGGRTATGSRTGSLPQSFDIEQNNWRPLNEHPQARDLARGIPLGQNRDPNGNTYSTEGTSTGAETGLSPNLSNTSNHPTPNSITPSDSRSSNSQHSQGSTNNGSYETSPAPNANGKPHRIMDDFFANRPDYNNIPPGTAMTPNAFSMPETPGRTYTTPGSWGQQANTGLTPVGEGVFRHMMGLGPMDPMDIWEGGT